MERKRNLRTAALARTLRRDMTRQERRLWYCFLRSYPVRFSRQKVLGRFIADFYCAAAKLVIELDGSQHYEPAALESDAARTAYLEGYSLRVVRIANSDVDSNFAGVCEYIDSLVQSSLRQADKGI